MNPIVAPRRPQILWTGCALLLAAVALHPAAASARTLLEAGQVSVWKYLDNGTRPAEAWRGVDFDDTPWKSGAAPLGFGDPGIGTEVGWGDRPEEKFTTTWFRRVFDKPELEPGDRLVISCRVDDGAVIHLNGKEIGRINMPPGPLAAGALAARELADRDEGFYTRLPVPAADLVPGKNVLAVEVYQASAKSGALFFDLALKALPADVSPLVVRDSARGAMTTFLREHYLGPGVTIPDGFTDGGRHTEFYAHGRPVSHREIRLVDRSLDK